MNHPRQQSVLQQRDQAMIDEFVAGVGRRVFILTPSFPFLFIGKILKVIDDIATIDVETTSVAQLEEKVWNVHIHSIEVFYIESIGGRKIPDLEG
ncbi:hypothetical protein H0266_14385 [Halobacillus locisalis]|uniref:DUF2642 domain-containing protein n=1 Tax=Halobacillus locisalis TaxID=220753 RepID=A0A838CVY6_9BACI|nr:hypothetical protein [Halobacillus locisalis]MBA2176081.1 hypothetical protein [Halobacillus locisalis]